MMLCVSNTRVSHDLIMLKSALSPLVLYVHGVLTTIIPLPFSFIFCLSVLQTD